jgi:hypothetical protein
MILRGDETEKVTVHIERKIKRKKAGGRIHIVTEAEDKITGSPFTREGV